jgi:hypothetical protein
LADCADGIDADYRARLEAAAQEVEKAAQDGAGSNPGDLPRLQAACAALDEATKPLAEILMDRAMEALLRQQGVID